MPSPLFFPIPLAGRLYDGMLGAGSLTTLAVAANTLYATPLFIPDTITVSALGVEVTTFATGNVRLGLYYDLAGQPGTLLLDGGATSTGGATSAGGSVVRRGSMSYVVRSSGALQFVPPPRIDASFRALVITES